jgi:hypothetical protein
VEVGLAINFEIILASCKVHESRKGPAPCPSLLFFIQEKNIEGLHKRIFEVNISLKTLNFLFSYLNNVSDEN